MRETRSAQVVDLLLGHEGLVTGDHGRGQTAALHAHLSDDALGERPTHSIDLHLQGQPPGRMLDLCKPLDRRQGEPDAANTVEERVAREVIGTRAGGRRGRIHHPLQRHRLSRRRKGLVIAQGDPHPDRRFRRRQPADADRRQEHPWPALAGRGDIDDESLDQPYTSAGGSNGRANRLGPQLRRRKAGDGEGHEH